MQSKLGSNHPVFTILLEENHSLFTTEGLELLLMECVVRVVDIEKISTHKSLVHDCIWMSLNNILKTPGDLDLMRRILSYPGEFTSDFTPNIENNNFYTRVGSLFGAKAMTDKFVFDIIRDNILEIQKQLNISGIKINHETLYDRSISYHISSGQLDLLEEDNVVLSQEKDKVVDFFLDIINLQFQYELFWENDKQDLYSFDEQKLRTIAQNKNIVRAYIRFESNCWQRTEGGWSGTKIERQDPDTITLFLVRKCDCICDYTETFVAFHPDKSRQPWL